MYDTRTHRAHLKGEYWRERASETGLLEAFAELEATKIGPAAVLMVLFKQGDMKRLLPAMNKTFAVTKYGGKTVIARTIGKTWILSTRKTSIGCLPI